MGILALGERLKAMYPYLGTNPHFACMECAKQTGLALTTGNHPARVLDDGDTRVFINAGQQPMVQGFQPGANRDQLIWQWLQHTAAPGVYAVDADDHAWNFVVMANRDVYLVDSSQHVFRQINGSADLIADVLVTGEPRPVRTNYADLDGNEMDFYYWGALSPAYAQVLGAPDQQPQAQQRPRTSSGSFAPQQQRPRKNSF